MKYLIFGLFVLALAFVGWGGIQLDDLDRRKTKETLRQRDAIRKLQNIIIELKQSKSEPLITV